jgi:S1-C subfamily serine protease
VVLSVLALVGGILVGRVTAGHSSNQAAPPVTQPGNTGNGFNGGNGGFFGGNGDTNGGNGGFFGGNGNSNGTGNGTSNGTGNGTTSPAANNTAAKVTPAVVNINTTLDSGAAAGTGMILTSDGYVLTNNHVINGATSITVEMQNGSEHSASVVGYDITDDVALIKVSGVSGLPTINSNSGSVSVGDSVVALGNALGKGGAPTVVTGSVTATKQTITASDDDGSNAETLHNLIQTNAPIQPGDSGGPLVNGSGRVIGMDSAASTSSGFGLRQASSSEGYAIPISDALTIANHIKSGDGSSTVHIGTRGIMGVALQTTSGNGSGDSNGFFGGSGNGGSSSSGAVIGEVESGSPAAHAGIQQGDTITGVGNTSVSSDTELTNAMNAYHPGNKVTVHWTDTSGKQHQASLKLVVGPPA